LRGGCIFCVTFPALAVSCLFITCSCRGCGSSCRCRSRHGAWRNCGRRCCRCTCGCCHWKHESIFY